MGPDFDRTTALFLDLDGTLLEIAATPETVVVPPSLPVLLEHLRALLGGALAIVSGRSIVSRHVRDPAFAHAGARGDPLVGGVEERREVGVGENGGGQALAPASDGGVGHGIAAGQAGAVIIARTRLLPRWY